MKENIKNLFVTIFSFLLSAALFVLIIFSCKEASSWSAENNLSNLLFKLNICITTMVAGLFLVMTYFALRLTIMDWKFNKEFEENLKIKTNYYLITTEDSSSCKLNLKKECKTIKEVHETLDTFRNGIQLLSPCSKYKVNNISDVITTFTLTVLDGREFIFKVEKKEKVEKRRIKNESICC